MIEFAAIFLPLLAAPITIYVGKILRQKVGVGYWVLAISMQFISLFSYAGLITLAIAIDPRIGQAAFAYGFLLPALPVLAFGGGFMLYRRITPLAPATNRPHLLARTLAAAFDFMLLALANAMPEKTVFLLLFWLYQVGMHAYRGQTLGKILLNIKVVSADGFNITAAQAVKRSLVYLPLLLLLGLSYFRHFTLGISLDLLFTIAIGLMVLDIIPLFADKRHLTIRDYLAKTKVVPA